MKKIRIQDVQGFDYKLGVAMVGDFAAIIDYAKENNQLLGEAQRFCNQVRVNRIADSIETNARNSNNRIPHVVPISASSNMIEEKDGEIFLCIPSTIIECEKMVATHQMPMNTLIGITDTQHFLTAVTGLEKEGRGYDSYGIVVGVAIDNAKQDNAADFSGYNDLTVHSPKSVSLRNKYYANTLTPEQKTVMGVFDALNQNPNSVLYQKINFNGGRGGVPISAIMDHAKVYQNMGDHVESLYDTLACYKSEKAKMEAIELMFMSYQAALGKIPGQSTKFGFIVETAPLFFKLLRRANDNRVPRNTVKNKQKGELVVLSIMDFANLDKGLRNFPVCGQSDVRAYVKAINYGVLRKQIWHESENDILRALSEFNNKSVQTLRLALMEKAQKRKVVLA